VHGHALIVDEDLRHLPHRRAALGVKARRAASSSILIASQSSKRAWSSILADSHGGQADLAQPTILSDMQAV